MKYNLRRTHNHQPTKSIFGAESVKRFHIHLMNRFRMIDSVNDDVALRKRLLNIAFAAGIMRAEIAFPVCPDIGKRFPVFFGMDDNLIIQRGMEIQHRFQHFVFHADQFHSLFRVLHRIRGDNTRDIADMAHVAVEHKAVARAGFRICLSGFRKPRHILINVVKCKDRFHPRNFHGCRCINFFYDCVRVRRTKKLDLQTACRSNVLRVHRLSGDQLLRVDLAERMIHVPQPVRVFYVVTHFSSPCKRCSFEFPASDSDIRCSGTGCPRDIP